MALALTFSRASQQATRPPTLGGRSHASHMITSLVSQNSTSSRLCDFPPFVANGNDLHHDAVSISYSCCRLLGERKRPPTKWESENRGKSLQRKDEKWYTEMSLGKWRCDVVKKTIKKNIVRERECGSEMRKKTMGIIQTANLKASHLFHWFAFFWLYLTNACWVACEQALPHQGVRWWGEEREERTPWRECSQTTCWVDMRNLWIS